MRTKCTLFITIYLNWETNDRFVNLIKNLRRRKLEALKDLIIYNHNSNKEKSFKFLPDNIFTLF